MILLKEVIVWSLNKYTIASFKYFLEVSIKSESPSFIINTSGTVGQPKIVVHTHGSLLASLQTRINWETKHGDTVLQLSASSWIMHLFEIFLPFVTISSGTLVMLRPGDNLNMVRLCAIIKNKQITILRIGSSMLKMLIDYLELSNSKSNEIFGGLRILWTGGESTNVGYLLKMRLFSQKTRIFVTYGLSEAMAAIGCYLDKDIDELANISSILPIGHVQPGYRCLLVSERDEQIILPSCSDEIGQIYLAGIM